MLAKQVTAIATSFENVKYLDGALAAKATFTGNPVRQSVIEASARPYLVPGADGRFNILVFGGSQGARYFSDTVPAAMGALPAALLPQVYVVQQAREEDVERVRLAYAQLGITAEVAPFFKDLPERMAASHLVIGRAGASTVAELTVIGRPGLLVPLPHALDNDQLNNARRLAESRGGWCIEQKDLSAERLSVEIARLLNDPQVLAAAAVAAKTAGRPDAVVRLADFAVSLASKAKA